MAPAPFTEKSILSALKCTGTFVVNQMTICVWGYVCTLFSSISLFLKIFPQTPHAIQIYWQSLLIEKSLQHSLVEQSFTIWSLHNTIQTSYHGILILVFGNLHPHSLCCRHSGLLSVPWTCCTWLSYQGPHTHSARQSVWLPYLPCSFLFINYAPVKCHLLCEAFQSKLDSLPTLYIFSWHHNL